MSITHHAVEDLGVMRMLPNMVIVAPGDPLETQKATRAVYEHDGPCYLRLGKAGEPMVHKTDTEFRLGKAIKLKEGFDITVISTGAMLQTAIQVSEKMETMGLSIRVLSMHTLKPLDEQAVIDAACETRAIVTLEEHSIIGGWKRGRGSIGGKRRSKSPSKESAFRPPSPHMWGTRISAVATWVDVDP